MDRFTYFLTSVITFSLIHYRMQIVDIQLFSRLTTIVIFTLKSYMLECDIGGFKVV